ncbi:MAG: glutamate formimidoyltransferase [Candidatus Neomarinimicrobiota bacterium]|nr:glutamate formimidoyltransferase [Candidatus Neomarinimicrobiota bacterium]
MQLIECVPNFSEGKDHSKINSIVEAISGVMGVKVLDVDLGPDTNRTVVTIVGSSDDVSEAAFQGIKRASEVIDMRSHSGAHPRMGSTDVCPFIPVNGISIEECVDLSKQVGRRVGDELAIPVYLYEYSAQKPERKNLANVRKGEYEGLADKLKHPEWAPDYGPSEFNARAGATVMGCREFLIAYNINLNTRDHRLATDIALELREAGRAVREPNPASKNILDGSILRYKNDAYPCGICSEICSDVDSLVKHWQVAHDENFLEYMNSQGRNQNYLIGKCVKRPGMFKDVKAIGWYVDIYHRAQISINFTNYRLSKIHDVYDVACRLADHRGIRVTGSELVGLIPLEAILMAGRHFLKKQNRSTGVPEADIVECAVQSLGLNDVSDFIPEEKIIDYAVNKKKRPLMDQSGNEFIKELSTNSPAPGGGSVSALAGAMGASLASMVAALTHEKKEFLTRKEEMNYIGVEAQKLKDRLAFLVDEDTKAFIRVMEANRLSDGTGEERKIKESAIEESNKYAIHIPLETAELSFQVMELSEKLVERGNPNSVSDAGVAAEVCLAAVRGACMNVKINLSGIDDQDYVSDMNVKVSALIKNAESLQKTVFKKTMKVIERDWGKLIR